MAAAFGCLTVGAGVAAAGGGGIHVPDPPHLRDVVCVNTCGGEHRATEGSKVEARGRHLGNVKEVLFNQRGGGRISVHPLSVAGRTVKAKVPATAADGSPKVVDRSGNDATSPHVLRIVRADQISGDGGFKLKTAKVDPKKVYYAGTRPARVHFEFSGSEPTDVRIQVVHRDDGRVASQWVRHGLQPNTTYSASWKGGAARPNGGYRFKIGAASTGKVDSTVGARFEFYKYKFPLQAHHTYGDGFGAPRGDHVHQGQDVMARCGAPLVAARAGRIQFKGYQAGGAGYYIVLDGLHDHHDYVYMHLRHPASVREGEHVKTGERVGVVGSTGDATACHLHFEVWKGDWWGGGHPMPAVTKILKRWDSWS